MQQVLNKEMLHTQHAELLVLASPAGRNVYPVIPCTVRRMRNARRHKHANFSLSFENNHREDGLCHEGVARRNVFVSPPLPVSPASSSMIRTDCAVRCS